MPYDLKALARNKTFLLGAAGAAGLGGIVWYQRRKNPASTGGSGGNSTSSGYPPAALGTYDSTGNDVANWLGNYSASLQQQMTDFLNQLQQNYNPPNPAGPTTIIRPMPGEPGGTPLGSLRRPGSW